MKLLECFVSVTLLSVVSSLPVKMICVEMCNSKITASTEFVNEWLSYSNAVGVHQLRRHNGTLIYKLLEDGSTDVS